MISIVPVEGLPEIRAGDDLGVLIAGRAQVEDGDVVVVAQKVVSKAEGRVVPLADVVASRRAVALAPLALDEREIEIVLREATRIVAANEYVVIAETRHGFVCASAGVDHSNAAEADTVILLPEDPDASARRIRASLFREAEVDAAVVVSDSFGRPFRMGTTDVAIGVAGLAPLLDLRGSADRSGRTLRSTLVAVADEIAAAADLVRGSKADGLPVVVVRGLSVEGDGTARELVMPVERDLFRSVSD